jgi:hypothetical protein
MIRPSKLLLAFALVLGLGQALPVVSAQAQTAPTPGAIAAAKELLALKNASAMYASIVPNIIQRTKESLVQSNLNYQKDLNEVAIKLAGELAGSEKAVDEAMAKVFATDFTEKELRDLVAFYKTPLGAKLLTQEPRSIQTSMQAMNEWAQGFVDTVNGKFRAEMRARGKEI